MLITKREKTHLEDEALIKRVLERLDGKKAEDFFPEKNKKARQDLIRAGLIKEKKD